MNATKLAELTQEFRRLGLDHTAEYHQLARAADNPSTSLTDAQLSQISGRLTQYRQTLQQFRTSRQLSQQSFGVFLAANRHEKLIVEPPKTLMEDRYRAYLKDKMRLKDDIKALRRQKITQELDRPDLTDAHRNQLSLELKFLGVMGQYETIRHQVVKGLADFSNSSVEFMMENHYLDRNFFRREKGGSNLERLENFELQIKIEQEKRKKLKQRSFMNEMFSCNSEFLEFHKSKFKKVRKLANSIKIQIEGMKKRDQAVDNDTRERLEALRAQNAGGYIDILKKAKDQRIIDLLEETDNFLREIGARVNESKGLEAPAYEKKAYDINQSMMLAENYNNMYYNFINKNLEEIKEQPSYLEGGQLKNYQMAGLQWMVSLYNNKVNGILADEMGLGKTIQTIALLCYIIEHKQNYGPFLVVVPLGTLTNWKVEFEKWAPSIKTIVYKGTPQERKEKAHYIRHNRFNVCLTTYEYVLKDKSELNRLHWQYIIVDEGHKMKNPKSQFAMTLGHFYNSEHRLLLTGTPLQNNLSELWSLLNFLLPKVFNSCEEFEKWFKSPMKRLGVSKEIELTEEEKLLIVNRFHQVLRPFLLRRVKGDVESELPQKIEYIIKVDMSAWQKIIYNQIAQNESKLILEQEVRANPNVFTKMNNMIMQLRKICNHPYLFQDAYSPSEELIRSSGKFELLDRIIPKLIKAGHRMLIFSQMTQIINLLEVFMQFRNFKYLSLIGSTKHEERTQRTDEFNKANSDHHVFLLSTRAGGLGLNLQTADTVILFDSDWNPQMDLQAQDRAHRIGTKREVRVLRLVCHGTIEEKILYKASYKRSLDEMVIQAGMYNNKSTEVERRQRLEEIIKKQNIQEKRDDEIPLDKEINHIISRSEKEFEMFQEMDKSRYDMEARMYPRFNRLINYRLISLTEVPDYIIEKKDKMAEAEELGTRRRIRIRNPEDLNDEHPMDEEIARAEKEKKRRLKERNQERKRRLEQEVEEPDEDQHAEGDEAENDIFIDSPDRSETDN